jgi:hypothetical protein
MLDTFNSLAVVDEGKTKNWLVLMVSEPLVVIQTYVMFLMQLAVI